VGAEDGEGVGAGEGAGEGGREIGSEPQEYAAYPPVVL